MTVRQNMDLIDKVALWRNGTLVFEVRILDVKESYGTLRASITPIAGDGRGWVSLDKLTNIREASTT